MSDDLATAAPAVASRRPSARPDIVRAALAALGCVLLAAPAGLVWLALAPRAVVVLNSQGADFADPETNDFVAAEGWFLLVTLVAGFLVGLLVWRATRRRPSPELAVGLVVGGLVAAYIAARTGGISGRAAVVAIQHGHGRTSGTLLLPLKLRMKALYVAWPVGALVGLAAPLLSTAPPRALAPPARPADA